MDMHDMGPESNVLFQYIMCASMCMPVHANNLGEHDVNRCLNVLTSRGCEKLQTIDEAFAVQCEV